MDPKMAVSEQTLGSGNGGGKFTILLMQRRELFDKGATLDHIEVEFIPS